jgi:hypothetical protein
VESNILSQLHRICPYIKIQYIIYDPEEADDSSIDPRQNFEALVVLELKYHIGNVVSCIQEF